MSQIKQKALVVGASHGKGEFNGIQFANTKIFVIDNVHNSNEAEKGHKFIEYKKKDYDLFNKLNGKELPAIMDLTLDFDGKYMNLVDFEYVEPYELDLESLAAYDYQS